MSETGETTTTDTELDPPPHKVIEITGRSKIGRSAPTSDDETDNIAESKRSRAARDRNADLPKELADVRAKENATLRDIANAFGEGGAFKIRVVRNEPEWFVDPRTGTRVPTAGYLRTYDKAIDEDYIQEHHGGGTYSLTFNRKTSSGSYVYFTHKTVTIVGDPKLDDTFRQVAPTVPAQAPTTSNENPTLVTKAFDALQTQLEKERSRVETSARPHGPDPAMDKIVELYKAQLDTQSKELAALRTEMTALRNQKPPEDPIKDKILDGLLKDDSARITALRSQYESEIRVLKEHHQQDLKLERDRHDRDRLDLKQMHERELTLMKQTHEIQLQAAKGAYELNMKVADVENRRVERDNGELRTEVKELRAKKDLGPLEMLKQAEQIKDAIGVGDGDDKSRVDQVIEALPGVIEAAKSYFKPPANTGQQPTLQPKRQVVEDTAGNKFILDDKGKLVPVAKKPKPKPAPQPGPNGEPPIPDIPAETINNIINYLERAFAGGQDPDVVAQSGRAMVPAEIITAIRDHQVDGFLTKVAKLPSTSPLSNQAGRNWMRKVGAALVGE